MTDEIDITGIDKAAVLVALYNCARVQGLGVLQAKTGGMSIDEARAELAAAGDRLYFDYLHGRVMKVALHGDTFSPGLYDRDNGHGAAQRALEAAGLAKKTERL